MGAKMWSCTASCSWTAAAYPVRPSIIALKDIISKSRVNLVS